MTGDYVEPWRRDPPVPAQPQPMDQMVTAQLQLAGVVATWVSAGWRIESQTPIQAVMVRGRRPNHVLHLLLTIVTMGLWLPVWILIALTSREQRAVLTAVPGRGVANTLEEQSAARAALPWWRGNSGALVLGVAIVVVFILASVLGSVD